jgi:predicted ATPase/class 3 adenylate cyclase
VSLPSGTITFLFTDIEGSTRLMQEIGEAYVQTQVEHHEILRAAFRAGDGREIRTEGDSFFCVFESALDACTAAAYAQREFARHRWPQDRPIRIRVGLHTGEAPLVGNEYIGIDVHHAARVASAAHGGQVVVSDATRALVESSLPPGLELRDLGLHRLKDLARPERLFQLVIEGAPDTFPALRTLDSTPNNLPTQLTSFIGREEQVAEARRLLEGTRLLTLTGPGGIGKTRLSLQIAAEVVQRFPDGVYFVPLSAVGDPQLVPSAIAQAIGLAVTGSRLPIDAVIEHLKERKVLLVFDNYEQLLPAGAPIVSQLLQAAPQVKVVVSSRAVLRLYGEQELALEPLHMPDLRALPSLAALSQFEAVRLFIERAVAAKHDFQVTSENAPAVAGICERVDGLPLAIELAAARVKLFSPQALLARLESSASVLGSGARDLPGRQQTLKGAIAWSYDLLDEPQRRLFARFSVFARGANLEQAEAVCGPESQLGVDVLTGLDELADQSLLRRLPDFDEPRLLMLHVIREFAAERLRESGEADAIRDRHAEAYARLAAAAAPNFLGPDQKSWLDRLELDHDNFRAAFDWSIAHGDVRRALRLGADFWRLWQMRGHLREGRTRLDAILAMPRSTDHPEDRLRALEALGGVLYWLGDMPGAQSVYDDIVEAVRKTGDTARIAGALYNAAFPRMIDRRSADGGLTLLQEAVPLFREVGDEVGLARCQWGIGAAMQIAGSYPAAKAALDEAIPLFRKIGDRFSLGWTLHTRTVIATHEGDVQAARDFVCEGMRIFKETGDLSGMALLLDDAASVEMNAGNRDRALRLAGAASAHTAAIGAGLGDVLGAQEGRNWLADLASDADRRAWTEGQAMTLENAIDYALSSDPTPSPSA